jgi:histone deacetylase 1/2
LELIYLDVWGHASDSVGGKKYYVSFIDDYSKFTWIYLLKFKSEVFEKFHEFQKLAERLFDRKILTMQTDWGGEYQKLHSFFEKVGITHHASCPHAHQQNGAAERKHRHIVEVGLSLLAHASMPLKFWDEAFLAATYLINRTPSKVIDYATPLECLFNQKPDYSSLRVLGCACYQNLQPYNRHKLEFRSKQCVFLGYSNMHKGFKCLEISSGRVYISRDVVFDEAEFPFSKLHSNVGARLRKEISLLPPSLLNISDSGQLDAHVTNLPADSNNFGGNYSENRTPDSSNMSIGATGQENTEHEADSSENPATPQSSAPGLPPDLPRSPPRPGAPLTARSPNQAETAMLPSRATHTREGGTVPTAPASDESGSATSPHTHLDPTELLQEDPAPGSSVNVEAGEQQARPHTR